MMEFCRMQSTPFIAVAPRSTLAGEVAPDRVQSIDQIELNSNYAKLICLKINVFNIQTVYLC